MSDMSEYELRYMEDEVLIAAAKEKERLFTLHSGLRQAANNGQLDVARGLLSERGIDIDDKDGAGWSALTWACKMGHLDVVRYFLSIDADINSTDNVIRLVLSSILTYNLIKHDLTSSSFDFVEFGLTFGLGMQKESSWRC